MVAKINNFVFRFFTPLFVGLIIAAITGLLSLAMDVVRLREDVKGLHDDVNTIKILDLPRLEKSVQEIHDYVLHYAETNDSLRNEKKISTPIFENKVSINDILFHFRKQNYQSKPLFGRSDIVNKNFKIAKKPMLFQGPFPMILSTCAHRLRALQIFPSGKSVTLLTKTSNGEGQR